MHLAFLLLVPLLVHGSIYRKSDIRPSPTILYRVDASNDTRRDDQVKTWMKDYSVHLAERTCLRFIETDDASKAIVVYYTDRANYRGACGDRQAALDSCNAHTRRCTRNDTTIYSSLMIHPECSEYATRHETMHALGGEHEQTHPHAYDMIQLTATEVEQDLYKADDDSIVFSPEADASNILFKPAFYYHETMDGEFVGKRVPTVGLYKRNGKIMTLTYSLAKSLNQLYCSSSCVSQAACHNDGYRNPNTCKCVCPASYAGDLCDEADEETKVIKLGANEKVEVKMAHDRNKRYQYVRIVAPKGQKVQLTNLTANFQTEHPWEFDGQQKYKPCYYEHPHFVVHERAHRSTTGGLLCMYDALSTQQGFLNKETFVSKTNELTITAFTSPPLPPNVMNLYEALLDLTATVKAVGTADHEVEEVTTVQTVEEVTKVEPVEEVTIGKVEPVAPTEEPVEQVTKAEVFDVDFDDYVPMED